MKIDEIIIIGHGNIGLLTAYFAKLVDVVSIFADSRISAPVTESLAIKDHVKNKSSILTTDIFPSSPSLFSAEKPVFVCVKAHQLEQSLYDLQPCLPEESHVYLLQNGLGHIDLAKQILPHCYIRPISITSGVNTDANGLNIVNYGGWHVGSENGLEPNPTDIALIDQLKKMQLDIQWSDDIRRVLIGKLLVNAAINPVTAVFNVANGELLSPNFEPMMNNIAEELAWFCAKQDFQYSYDDIIKVIKHVASSTHNNRSSMLQDITNKRPTEVDAILGFILSCTGEAKDKLATLGKLYQQIKTIEKSWTSKA